MGLCGQPQLGENLGNHCRVFDGGDERHLAAKVRTVCHVDFKHPFEQLGPAVGVPVAHPLTSTARALTQKDLRGMSSSFFKVQHQLPPFVKARLFPFSWQIPV